MAKIKIHIVYNFTDTPFGGANQFLKALRNYFIKKGCYANSIRDADVVLLNSHLFGQGITLFNIIWKNRHFLREKTVLHRVDGPVSLYQAKNRFSVDKYIFKISRLVSDGTVYQSFWSQKECKSIGMPSKSFELTTINAPDPKIFFPKYLPEPSVGEKFKLVANSWSTNPNKGFEIFEYIDSHLDFEKYEVTFIGRTPIPFRKIKMIKPLSSIQLAEQLREHHIFVSASFREACSNSLIEGIHCGCIPVARNTSSHPEIIKENGILFEGPDDVLNAIDKAAKKYEELKEKPILPKLLEIGQRYYDFCLKVNRERHQKDKKLSFCDALSFKWSELQFMFEKKFG